MLIHFRFLWPPFQLLPQIPFRFHRNDRIFGRFWKLSIFSQRPKQKCTYIGGCWIPWRPNGVVHMRLRIDHRFGVCVGVFCTCQTFMLILPMCWWVMTASENGYVPIISKLGVVFDVQIKCNLFLQGWFWGKFCSFGGFWRGRFDKRFEKVFGYRLINFRHFAAKFFGQT